MYFVTPRNDFERKAVHPEIDLPTISFNDPLAYRKHYGLGAILDT
jgi:hypothetical protein